jgi:hypothetical protein
VLLKSGDSRGGEVEGRCDRVREEEEEIELLTTVPSSFRACVCFPSWGSFCLGGPR